MVTPIRKIVRFALMSKKFMQAPKTFSLALPRALSSLTMSASPIRMNRRPRISLRNTTRRSTILRPALIIGRIRAAVDAAISIAEIAVDAAVGAAEVDGAVADVRVQAAEICLLRNMLRRKVAIARIAVTTRIVEIAAVTTGAVLGAISTIALTTIVMASTARNRAQALRRKRNFSFPVSPSQNSAIVRQPPRPLRQWKNILLTSRNPSLQKKLSRAALDPCPALRLARAVLAVPCRVGC